MHPQISNWKNKPETIIYILEFNHVQLVLELTFHFI